MLRVAFDACHENNVSLFICLFVRLMCVREVMRREAVGPDPYFECLFVLFVPTHRGHGRRLDGVAKAAWRRQRARGGGEGVAGGGGGGGRR